MMRGFWVAVIAVLMAQPVIAEVKGQSDPAFVTAINAWLAADEAQALPAMARLAASDNTAAQLFLGILDTTPMVQGDWLMAQTRADRIALLRRPGGLSGGNWLREAAADTEVAATWLKLWDGDASPQVVLDFARLHEPRAARVAGLALAARQVRGFADLAGDAAYPASLQVYAISEWQDADPARAESAIATLAAADPQLSLLNPTPPAPDAVSGWIASVAAGNPLTAFCAALCRPDAQATCLAATFRVVGGYHGLMRLGSPFEALIASPDFNHSPQGLAIVSRWMRQDQIAMQEPLLPPESLCLPPTPQ